jgi:putative hydrolase of the HAD superfamily
MTRSLARAPRRALIVDFMGVLTVPVAEMMHDWMVAEGFSPEPFARFMHELMARTSSDESGPVHGLETGRWTPAEFERTLAEEIAQSGLGTVSPDGLLKRMFGGLAPDRAMMQAVAELHASGVPTALLSNAFGLEYPRADWPTLFDVTVISDEVGLRKPDPAIYLLTCTRLGVNPRDAVFVDDLEPNVVAAEALGMAGVHHTESGRTIRRVYELLGAAR